MNGFKYQLNVSICLSVVERSNDPFEMNVLSLFEIESEIPDHHENSPMLMIILRNFPELLKNGVH